jgi:hypothetical protein
MAEIDLQVQDWHHRLHGVTAAMATHWRRVTAPDLERWAAELSAIAHDMVKAAADAAGVPATDEGGR